MQLKETFRNETRRSRRQGGPRIEHKRSGNSILECIFCKFYFSHRNRPLALDICQLKP